MKKLLIVLMGMGAFVIVLISSGINPVSAALAGDPIYCLGPACENANGYTYNTYDPLFGTKKCCGIADDDRGCQQGS